MAENLVPLEDMNALHFGILCNFPAYCGKERTQEAADILLKMKNELYQYRALGTVEELTKLVKAKQEGRCVVLPCKVGDTIYRVAYDCAGGIKYNPFNEHGVSYAEPCLKCNTYPCDIHKAIYEIKAVSSIWIMENAKNGNFGTKYFLTHEEAEAALAKEDNDERD